MENPTTTLNYTTHSATAFYPAILELTLHSITFIVGSVGNGLVIWITGFKMKKTVITIWYLNLAIADLIFCLNLPFYIADQVVKADWLYGQVLCKLLNTSFYLNLCVSTFFLMTISIDRCVCVVWPLWSHTHRTTRLAKFISVIMWLLSLALCSPYLAFYDVEYDSYSNRSICFATYGVEAHLPDLANERHHAMILTRCITMFLIPFTIILICYSLIIFQVRRSRRASQSSQAFKVTITVVLCFFFCWFLFHLLPIMEIFSITLRHPYHEIVFSISECLANVNSCLNPIIYVFVGQNFKKILTTSISSLVENAFKEK